ncbi:hypothetical protein LUZ61_013689 [Rhynchospora tenuis]|uniref:Clp R domain-containing protein n=1 Tax=Rhynchospora tenuis TaxID=198213 RepID=A0AAD5W9V7_9POAL|nr:hypothetical protein LUZ61_013689 [Rhynchospora tenuis]
MATTRTVQGLYLSHTTVPLSSNSTSKSNLLLQPSLISCPTSLSPRLRNRLSLSSRPRCVAALTLPTAKPERVTSDGELRWSARAIKSFALAELQARSLKRPKLDTEALLLGVLVDGTSEGAKYLREMGITLSKVREETCKVIGEWDWRYKSPLGLSLSDSAQRALDWAVDYKLKSGKDGEITVGHLVLGIWKQKESTGHKVLAALGFDSKKAKEFSKVAGNDAALSYR